MSRRNAKPATPTLPRSADDDLYATFPSRKYTGEKARSAGRNVLAFLSILREWKDEDEAKRAAGSPAGEPSSAATSKRREP